MKKIALFVTLVHVNNQGADQAVHLGSLIRSFVICLKPQSHRTCNLYTTKKMTIAERLKRLRQGFIKVATRCTKDLLRQISITI